MSLLLALLAALAGLALAGLGVFWVGFQSVPTGYPDLPSSALGPQTDSVPLATGLPPALEHHFRRVLGLEAGDTGLPRLSTAVVWGRGRIRYYGFLVPMRFRSLHRPGEAFLRTIEVTWFGRAVLRIREELASGSASRSYEGWTQGHETGAALAETLRQSLWREALWAPTVLATASWKDVSESRWSCPAAGFEATIDAKSGRLASLEGQCPFARGDGDGGDSNERWKATLGGWQAFHGIEIPTQVWLRHRHQQGNREGATGCREADAVFVAQGVAYNLNLPEDLRQAQRSLSPKTSPGRS